MPDMKNTTKTHLCRAVPCLSIAFWLLCWLVLALLFAKPLLLPTPLAVLRKLGELAMTAHFWQMLGLSLLRIAAGIAAAIAAGALMAALTVRFSLVHHLFSPLLSLLKSTPVASVIFLLMLFMGRNTVPLFIAFAMALPIVWSNLREGLLQVDKKLFEMATVFGVPRTKKLTGILLPEIRPYFMAACRAAISLAWKAGVAAEVLAVPERSIGRAIYESRLYLLTEELFAYTLTVIVISALLEQALLYLIAPSAKKGDEISCSR